MSLVRIFFIQKVLRLFVIPRPKQFLYEKPCFVEPKPLQYRIIAHLIGISIIRHSFWASKLPQSGLKVGNGYFGGGPG